MRISITGNNEIKLLTFMFTIKEKKDEKSINIIVIKQTNRNTKIGYN